MTPLDRLTQTARIHGFDVDLTADLITVHVHSWVQAMHFYGSCVDTGAGPVTCDGVPVRFQLAQVRVPRQREATA